MAIQTLQKTAHAAADAAREAVLPYFRSGRLNTENKLDVGFDPVTDADRAAEQAMRDVLSRMRPNDAIQGEEFGYQRGSSGITWVLDPIDGTRSFLMGAPVWGILIAAVGDEGPLYGIIDQPYTGERFEGGLGVAQVSGPLGTAALKARSTQNLDEAILCTTFPEIGTEIERSTFTAVAREVKLCRYGLDCYAYALLAAGHIDLVIEAGLNNYDICAPIAVIQAAGGIITNWHGEPAHHGGRILAAASPELHRKALAILSQYT